MTKITRIRTIFRPTLAKKVSIHQLFLQVKPSICCEWCNLFLELVHSSCCWHGLNFLHCHAFLEWLNNCVLHRIGVSTGDEAACFGKWLRVGDVVPFGTASAAQWLEKLFKKLLPIEPLHLICRCHFVRRRGVCHNFHKVLRNFYITSIKSALDQAKTGVTIALGVPSQHERKDNFFSVAHDDQPQKEPEEPFVFVLPSAVVCMNV